MLVLGIVLFVLIALAWGATLLLKFTLWPAIVFTVLAVLLFVGLLVFRQLRAASRAAALERELLKQAADQAARVRPDQRPEILALREQMKAGIAALKRSKLGAKGGRSALYALPWYMFVGPPAAGKTTAIERSGLAFAGGKTGNGFPSSSTDPAVRCPQAPKRCINNSERPAPINPPMPTTSPIPALKLMSRSRGR